jgi:hypothetical protein
MTEFRFIKSRRRQGQTPCGRVSGETGKGKKVSKHFVKVELLYVVIEYN